MSENLPWNIVVLYCTYAAFGSVQKFFLRDYKGGNHFVTIIVGLFALLTMVFGIGFLVYYGYSTRWWTPFVLFVLGIIAYIPVALLEELFSLDVLVFVSFGAVPFCGYLLLQNIPQN